MDLECFQAISVHALGPLEMKLCAECHHNAHCINCERKENKFSYKKVDCKYKKVFVILFADMVSRAVDPQLMQNRSTEAFLMAFISMSSAKSTPRFILSDNAGEFTRADKEIQEVMELVSSEEVRKKLGEQGIERHLIPARSPQHNGFTEIHIEGPKNCLYKIFKGKRLTETELTTAIKQSESQLNAQPLLAISDGKDGNNRLTLTPLHLLLGRPLVTLHSSWDKFGLDKIRKLSVLTRWAKEKCYDDFS